MLVAYEQIAWDTSLSWMENKRQQTQKSITCAHPNTTAAAGDEVWQRECVCLFVSACVTARDVRRRGCWLAWKPASAFVQTPAVFAWNKVSALVCVFVSGYKQVCIKAERWSPARANNLFWSRVYCSRLTGPHESSLPCFQPVFMHSLQQDSSAPLQLGSHLLVENAPFAECVLAVYVCSIQMCVSVRVCVCLLILILSSLLLKYKARMAHSNFNKIHYEHF